MVKVTKSILDDGVQTIESLPVGTLFRYVENYSEPIFVRGMREIMSLNDFSTAVIEYIGHQKVYRIPNGSTVTLTQD